MVAPLVASYELRALDGRKIAVVMRRKAFQVIGGSLYAFAAWGWIAGYRNTNFFLIALSLACEGVGWWLMFGDFIVGRRSISEVKYFKTFLTLFSFETSEFYRAIGTMRLWNFYSKIKLYHLDGRSRTALESQLFSTVGREVTHAVMFMQMMVLAYLSAKPPERIGLLISSLIVNIPPMLLQRYKRGRLLSILRWFAPDSPGRIRTTTFA